MAEEKRFVEEITPMDEDFARWYTDIVTKADLIEHASVRGCCVIRPYAYAIWENIQKTLDAMFKATGHENVYMPMFIPESLAPEGKIEHRGTKPQPFFGAEKSRQHSRGPGTN